MIHDTDYDTIEENISIYWKFKNVKDDYPCLRESDKLQEKRKELTHEVDNLKRTLVKQLNLTTAERKRIESSLSDERQLVLDLVEFRAALQEITRITSLKTIERDNKAREYLKAEGWHVYCVLVMLATFCWDI